jgi:Asp-tRNA(Asn)/Glu-tRNA(Gln) amidotransferase A subunit family amidase
MPARDLHYSELAEVGQRIQKRELSSAEATQAQLDRIARLDGQLKSYAYVMTSSALEQAHAADKEIAAGKVRGPLHGVPITVKDLCWTGLIELGLQQSGTDYQKIVLRREAFRGMMRALFEKVDLLAVPAQTFAAPTLAKMATLGENPELIAGLLRFSCPFDMTGSPTITLPGGFTESGGPVAFQFVGRHFNEARLVAAGNAFQRVTDFHRRHPTL